MMKDFYTLKERYSALNFTLIQGIAPQTDSPKAPKCSEKLITTDGFTTNFTVPVLPPNASEIIENGVKPAPIGKIITIDNYNVKVTVKDNSGNVLSNLAVIPLDADEINKPGNNGGNSTGSDSSSGSGSDSESGSTSTTTTTDKTKSSGSSTSSTSAAAGTRFAQGELMSWMVSAVMASFLVGFLG